MIRKFRRNQVRKKVGNKNLKSSWEKLQRAKYGIWYKCTCKKKIYVFQRRSDNYGIKNR